MPLTRLRRRLIAWIAIFAVLAGALAPAASQAMSAFGEGQVRWIEVCSSSGTSWIPVAADQAPDGDETPGVQSSHCPYCCPHAGAFALPPSPVALFPVLEAQRLEPPLFLAAPRPLFAWASSRPRAPPLAT